MNMITAWMYRWLDILEPVIYLSAVAAFIVIVRRGKSSKSQDSKIRELEDRIYELEKRTFHR